MVASNAHWIGIDYGAKAAGTTCICYCDALGNFNLYTSEKGKDADAFVLQHALILKPTLVFIDAPLSLPIRLLHPEYKGSWFYRTGDAELGAMSPMFLGGLTARAMALAYELRQNGIEAMECYPAAFLKRRGLKHEQYKQDKSKIAEALLLLHAYPRPKASQFSNWHFFDAFLAWCIGYDYVNGCANIAGNAEEGSIIY